MSEIDSEARPAPFTPQAGIGIPLAVATFGFSVLVLGLANARVFNPAAVGIFVPVAMATGGLGLLVGGLFEFRANNTFGGTFAVLYAGFLLTTALILRYYGPGVIVAAGALGFGDAFGAWLLLWGVFTVLLSAGAYYINMPAFLAFVLLAIVYFLAAVVNIGEPESNTLLNIAGWVGILDGLCAWWVGFGLVLNTMGPRPRIPMIPYPYGSR